MPKPTSIDKDEEEVTEVLVPASAKPSGPWIPLLVAILVMPAISFAMTQYVLIPQIKLAVAHPGAKGVAKPHEEKASAHKADGDKKGEEKPTSFSYDFDNIVVNLSGTKGTRYLKASFTAFSPNPEMKSIITKHKNELLDLTLNVLSEKTLADLELAGAKNMLRHALIENFNHALNSTLIDQIYFSEFVVQ